MSAPLILELLNGTDWGAYQGLVRELHQWEKYPLFEEAVYTLKREALFESAIHGPGHIERTLCHGAFCAMAEGLSEEDTRLLLLACAYHDIGRKHDSLDDLHGWRSAQQLPQWTDLEGEERKLVQAAVDAHSRNDKELEATLEGYQLADPQRGKVLALLLKDADGLDRVRIWDLDPVYLRREASRQRAGFAKELYIRYQTKSGGVLVPDFVKQWKGLDDRGEKVATELRGEVN
jgi:hypothetical protein